MFKQLLRDLLLIGPLPVRQRSTGGIALLKNDDGVISGMVLAMGPGQRDKKGNLIPMPCKLGQKVMFAKSNLTEVKIQGESVIIVPASEILCVLED